MKFPYLVQRIHLWLGLLLGAQVLLWMTSGVIMSWFHITLVRGETNSMTVLAPELAAQNYASPGGIIAQWPGATSLTLNSLLERPVYLVEGAGGAAIFDAQSGAQISPIDEKLARRIARRDFVGKGAIERMELLSSPPHEYGRPGPVWRATFDDRLDTRLYISPETGEIKARRNAVWRLYDFFWMLHIMDYSEREDFNNPLIRTASATGFLFALTGLILVVYRLTQGRYRLRAKMAAGDGDENAASQNE